MNYQVWMASTAEELMDKYTGRFVHIPVVSEKYIDMFLALAQSGLCAVAFSAEPQDEEEHTEA